MKSRKGFVTGVIFILTALGISAVDLRVAKTSVLGKSKEQVVNAFHSSANKDMQPSYCLCWMGDTNRNGYRDLSDKLMCILCSECPRDNRINNKPCRP